MFKLTDYEIIFIGDSAGGNLIAGLQNWLIINELKGIKLKQPKALVFNYPGDIISYVSRSRDVLTEPSLLY